MKRICPIDFSVIVQIILGFKPGLSGGKTVLLGGEGEIARGGTG
ncbi:hypothetical protein KNP414_02065 [Paenibacillus mucilaginosus KNP414]|uniref:Uncharacterized protein n=1 Tax=Paenibacillus mucilaginosus (strain KNP414) TaxID=1036673 RepID=F8FRR9_PAEMK|nr:hypothetical protein KNP414_02065 [Paenibacillus mucilaginosus KNP414]